MFQITITKVQKVIAGGDVRPISDGAGAEQEDTQGRGRHPDRTPQLPSVAGGSPAGGGCTRGGW